MRLALIAAIALVGCTKTETPPAPAPAPTPVAAAKPMVAADQVAQMQKAMQAAGTAQQKTAVNWRELMPLLGDSLGGWKASGEAKGETNSAMGMTVSQVARSYTKDGKQAQVEIFDTAVMPMLAQAFQVTRMASSDGSDHYAKPIDIAGNPGWDEWKKDSAATVTALIAGRFLVKAGSSGLADSKPMAEIVKSIDVAKLAKLDK